MVPRQVPSANVKPVAPARLEWVAHVTKFVLLGLEVLAQSVSNVLQGKQVMELFVEIVCQENFKNFLDKFHVRCVLEVLHNQVPGRRVVKNVQGILLQHDRALKCVWRVLIAQSPVWITPNVSHVFRVLLVLVEYAKLVGMASRHLLTPRHVWIVHQVLPELRDSAPCVLVARNPTLHGPFVSHVLPASQVHWESVHDVLQGRNQMQLVRYVYLAFLAQLGSMEPVPFVLLAWCRVQIAPSVFFARRER